MRIARLTLLRNQFKSQHLPPDCSSFRPRPEHVRSVVHRSEVGGEEGGRGVGDVVDEGVLDVVGRIERGRRVGEHVLVQAAHEERVLALGTLSVVEPPADATGQ